jgi:DNA gyrase subunit B
LLNQFEGQTKTKLGNRSCFPVKSSGRDMIETYLEENQMMPNHCSKVILAAQARHAAKKAREMVQKP